MALPLRILLLLTALDARAPETVERQAALMGTLAWVEVVHADREQGLRASEAALSAMRAVEERLSTWSEESELARLNAAPVGSPFALSPALQADLEQVVELWHATGGAFDPGVGGLVRAWGLRTGGRQPSDVELEAARAAEGLASLVLEGNTARRRHAGLNIEEGAFGKGVALDAALEALRAAGARSAVVDLGGQVALLTADGTREIPVAHPDRREEPVVVLSVSTGSVATSGNSERAILVDGVRCAHILDPATGRPAPDFGSVTVWAGDAFRADALSTALFVMGADDGLAFAEEQDGIEALVLERLASGLRMRATSGLRGRLRCLNEDQQVEFLGAAVVSETAGPGNDR